MISHASLVSILVVGADGHTAHSRGIGGSECRSRYLNQGAVKHGTRQRTPGLSTACGRESLYKGLPSGTAVRQVPSVHAWHGWFPNRPPMSRWGG